MGQSARSERLELTVAESLVLDCPAPLRTGLVQVSTVERTLRVGTLDSVEA